MRMLWASQRYPQHSSNATYLKKVGRNAALKWLFASWLNMEMPIIKSDSFLESNFDKIWQFLLEIRLKKGGRGLAAANRDAQILLLVGLGWENEEIDIELGLKSGSSRHYRRQIQLRLQSFLAQNNGEENRHVA
jgi:hypothetical protein